MTANTVYFVQHGQTADKIDNPERPLLQDGLDHTLSIAKHLHSTGVHISRIFHSGKLRALQTAEIFASNLSITSVTEHAHLSPNDNVELLANDALIEDALYIGHLPHLEKLVCQLVSNNDSQDILRFQNSAIICLKKGSTNYHIHWYLTPELLLGSRL